MLEVCQGSEGGIRKKKITCESNRAVLVRLSCIRATNGPFTVGALKVRDLTRVQSKDTS